MTRRYFITFVLSCLLPWHIVAQNEINTSLFSGRLIYTIPIYSIEDPDLHFDIALRYQSEGFKPFQPSGCYGQDWTLIAGGCITRSVQGIPDERKMYEYTGWNIKDTLWGFSKAIQAGNIPNKNAIFNMDESVYGTCGVLMFPESGSAYPPCQLNNIDYIPDIFHFNFCGHKGSFIINNEGIPRIISGDFVNIDISQMQEGLLTSTEVSSTSDLTFPSQITISCIDGYTYVFGEGDFSREYISICGKNESLYQNQPAITAWHLTRIIAPNGRSLILNYSYAPITSSSSSVRGLASFITDYDWSEFENTDTHITYALHKECLLQSVTTSDSIPLEIFFISHQESTPMYEHDDFTYCVPHLQLDSIIVKHNGNILRTANLSYQYKSYSQQWNAYPNYHWRYLCQVSISGTGKYNITYAYVYPNPGNTPYPIYLSYYPSLYPQSDVDYKNMVDRMGFWKATPLQGMLSEVSLPTGGRVKFTYGSHQYSEERRFRAIGTQDVELYSQSGANQIIGGARIEKIETFSNENGTPVETQTFRYTKQGNTTSSGIFYNKYEIFFPTQCLPIIHPENYALTDFHIGYSYVEKETTIGTEKYKTAYFFDTGIENYSSAGNSHINRRTDISGYSDTAEVCSGSLTHPEKLIRPGKLMAVEQYRGNTLAQSTLFEYNGIMNSKPEMLPNSEPSLGSTDTIVFLSKYSGHVTRKLYVYPDVLEKIVTYEYGEDGEPMIIEKSFTHDNKLRKRREITFDSRNRKLFSRYTYPDDLKFNLGMIPLSQYPGLWYLVQAHHIDQPVEKVTGFIENNEEQVISGTIHLYATGRYFFTTPGSVQMQSYYYPYLYRTLSLALESPTSTYQYMGTSGTTVTYDSAYKLDTEYSFDNMGRMTLIKPFGKIATKYTWNTIYPATKTIWNQTYTYTYIPYVGIGSSTDQRGLTTFYSYDEHGRLIEEYQMVNGKKQILKVYQYHIKTE